MWFACPNVATISLTIACLTPAQLLCVPCCAPLQELSRRLTVAMQEAHGKSVTGMKEKMKDLAKSLGLPNPAALTGGAGGM